MRIKIVSLMGEDEKTTETKWWTISEILEEINRDRSDTWSAYDESDWLEGWLEWVEPSGFHSLG